MLICTLFISSFDHDGLGRYGDPINPEGDLQAMQTVASVLRDDGILFLTVPIGTYTVDTHAVLLGCSRQHRLASRP